MNPFSLNLAMAASLVKSVAAFSEKPSTASIFAWPGVASNVAVNGAVCRRSGVFVQPVAALWTQSDAAGAACTQTIGIRITMAIRQKTVVVVLSGISGLDLNLAHRTLLLPSTQRIRHQSRPQRDRGVPTTRFCRLTGLACCRVTDFSDTNPTLLPWPQILQPQSVCYPLGTGRAQIRRSISPKRRRCSCLSANNSQELNSEM